MPVHRVLPDTAERPFWSSRSFLVYMGVFVALLRVGAPHGCLGSQQRAARRLERVRAALTTLLVLADRLTTQRP